jgi:uncharacterized protein
MLKRLLMVVVIGSTTLLAGCAGNALRSYDSELKETVTLVKTGAIQQAIDNVEKNNKSMFASEKKEGADKSAAEGGDKDILYFMEKGQLLNLQSKYQDGRDTWLKADEIVRVWEDEFRTDPAKLFGDIGSYLISDRLRRYDGQDYEKVALSSRLMLNHIMLGDAGNARVEMKKTVEREKLIEAFREKEYEKIKEDAASQKVSADVSVLSEKGYPMAELETPEVRNLKNGFQNAFAHYLAGYFFEVTGELGLAEPGYRNAVALQPNSKLVRDGLEKVGRRKPGANQSDVLFVVESGFAPSWKSMMVPIPVPTGKGLIVTPISFPLLKAENPGFVPPNLVVGKQTLPVETVVNVDTMARRLLKDQMPGIVLRTIIRAVAKSVAQDQAQKAGMVAGLLTTVAAVVTEQADERSWRTLPERISIARATLPYGTLALEFQTGAGVHRTEINIANRYTIVPIRLTGGAVYIGEQNIPGVMAAVVPEVQPVKLGGKPKPVKKAPAKAPAGAPAAAAPAPAK